jgi:hypothetical protein
MKNLQEVYPGVKEDSPATIVDTQRENSAAESGEQRAQDDIEKHRPDSGDSDVVSTMQQPLAAPRATPQTSKNSAISESQEEETAATQRVTESAVDHRGSDFKELLDYYEKELGGKREGALEEKPPLKGVTTSNSTTSDNASKQSSGVLTVDDVGPPRSPTHTPHPSPSPEIKSSSDGTTKEGGGGGLLSSLVGTKIVPMVAPLVTPLVSAVTVVGEGTAAVNDVLSLAHNSACIIIIITITLQLQRCHKPQDWRLGFPALNDSPNVAHDSFKLFALVDQMVSDNHRSVAEGKAKQTW